MKWLFFLFSMNLFLTYYPVEITSCDQNIQVKFEERTQTLELFNVEVQDMKRACELLQNASAVHIAFEPNMQQEDILSAWVFVDDMLLQQILIDEEVASIVRKNPTYQYQLDKSIQKVSVPLKSPIVANQTRGMWILLLHFLISVLVVVMSRWVKY